MEHNLTKTQLMCLFGSYFGASFISFRNQPGTAPVPKTIKGIRDGLLVDWGNKEYPIRNCRLVLSRLADIKDAHAIEAMKIWLGVALNSAADTGLAFVSSIRFDVHRMELQGGLSEIDVIASLVKGRKGINQLSIRSDGLISGRYLTDQPATACPVINQDYITDYLKGEGYAFSFMGFDLFKYNLAINKARTT